MRPPYCLLVAAAIAALSALPPASAKTVVSPDGYRISIPDDWATEAGPPDSQSKIVFYYLTGERRFPAVQVLTRSRGKMTMPFLAYQSPIMIRRTFAGFQQTAAGWTTLDGVPAYDIRGTYPRGPLTVCVRQVFTLRGGEAYMITTAYPSRVGAACAPVSSGIIRSILWQ